jgi:hypothetical protein
MEDRIKDSPKVIASGYLKQFNNIPCYNLDNGQRVFRLSDMTLTIRGKRHGKFANYLAPPNIKKYIPKRLWPDLAKDRFRQGVTEANDNGHIVPTYDAEDFIDICLAFIKAQDSNEKLSIAQQEIVDRARDFIAASAKIGITGLIDEATGFQYLRPADELEYKMAFFLADELRPWEKTFDDRFWIELGRLTNWTNVKLRPKYWGKLVNEFVYDALDPDIAKYLRENKPPRLTGVHYHRWLREDKGAKALTDHILILIGMAKGCDTLDEFRYEVHKEFPRKMFQWRLFTPRQYKQLARPKLITEKEKFDKAIDTAIKPKSAPTKGKK